MELTFVVAFKNIWQLQPSWLHPCKVWDQRQSVGKIEFTRNRKLVGLAPPPPLPLKDSNRCILTLLIQCFWKLELLRNFL